jgi:phosphinothricin acetyltransferase
MEGIIIRNAVKADAEAIQAIYAPYVAETAISFEYEAPTVEEMVRRMEEVQKGFPWLVAEEDGRVVGYAYAHAFHERAAFQWAVETSIYVKQNEKRKGIGRTLHDALETTLKQQGILNLNASIAYINPEDKYLTQDSMRFHQQMGYKEVAHFHQCGKKFGRWYDMIWMEKIIGEHL